MPLCMESTNKKGIIMSFNVGNVTESFEAWKSYRYGNNSYGITSYEIGQIEERWHSHISEWRVVAEQERDTTEYVFEEEDKSKSEKKGRDSAVEVTKYENTKKDQKKQETLKNTNISVSTVNSAGTIVGAGFAAAGGALETAGCVLSTVGCTIAFAVGLMWELTKPNEKQAKAAKELNDKVLPDAQKNQTKAKNEQEGAVNVMEAGNSAAGEMASDAVNQYDETQALIEEMEAEYEEKKTTYLELQEKIDNGEPLTEEEKAEYKECVEYMNVLGVDISTLSEDSKFDYETASEAISEFMEEQFGVATDLMDTSNERMSEVDGITKYAKEFDEKTATACAIEMGAQIVNATGGAIAAAVCIAKACTPFTLWMLVFAGLGLAGSGMSIHGAVEEGKWLKDVKDEIELRGKTEKTNSDLHKNFDENVTASYEEQQIVTQDTIGLVDILNHEYNEEVTEEVSATEIPKEDVPKGDVSKETPKEGAKFPDTEGEPPIGEVPDKEEGTKLPKTENESPIGEVPDKEEGAKFPDTEGEPPIGEVPDKEEGTKLPKTENESPIGEVPDKEVGTIWKDPEDEPPIGEVPDNELGVSDPELERLGKIFDQDEEFVT